jgi:hypothetical protein
MRVSRFDASGVSRSIRDSNVTESKSNKYWDYPIDHMRSLIL